MDPVDAASILPSTGLGNKEDDRISFIVCLLTVLFSSLSGRVGYSCSKSLGFLKLNGLLGSVEFILDTQDVVASHRPKGPKCRARIYSSSLEAESETIS